MPNEVKENKSEEKFKGEGLGINDKFKIINWLFVLFCFFLLGVYLLGIMTIKWTTTTKNKQTGKQVGEGIRLLEYIL